MIVNKQQLKNALAKAGILTAGSLAGGKIRFTAEGGVATITASNGTGLGIFKAECGEGEPISFVVGIKRLAVVNAISGDPDFKFAAGRLSISCGETAVDFPVEAPEALAVEDRKLDSAKAFAVDPVKLKQLFDQVGYACAPKDALFVNYSFGSDGRNLFARTSNSRIAVRATLPLDEGIAPFEVTITPTAAAMLGELDEDGPAKIAITDSCIEMESARMTAFVHYPDKALPAAQIDSLIDNGDAKAEIAIAKYTLLESIGIFALAEAKDVTFEKDGDGVILTNDSGITAARDRIPLASSEGDSFKFTLDLGQAKAIFQSLKDAPTMQLRVGEPNQPVRFGDGVGMAGVVTTLVS